MELLEAIEARRSNRAFKSTPVPKETIEKILAAAGKSPSYSNTQPWEVVVVSGKRKEELSRILCELVKSGTATNPDLPTPGAWPPELKERARQHDVKRFKALGIEQPTDLQRKELRLQNFEFYGAPCVLFLFMDSTLGTWSVFDMGTFAHGIILAATSSGLGSCLQAVVTGYPDAVREFLCIPKTKHLVLGIPIGYPDPEAQINAYRSEKIAPADFVHWCI